MKDWNDALRAGVNIREIGDSAKPWTPKGNGKDQDDLGFNLICLADVDPVPIDWIWEGHLARGKLTLIGGDPDLGKSLLCTDAAARLSRGAHWPRGARANIGGTIFICSEDSTADTIRPRVEAAGADLSMLQVFKSTLTTKDGKRKTFSLQEDLDVLGGRHHQSWQCLARVCRRHYQLYGNKDRQPSNEPRPFCARTCCRIC